MTATVGYAALQIIPSLKGASASIQSQLSGPASTAGVAAGAKAGEGMKKGLGSQIGSIAKVLAGAFVVKKGYDFFKDAVKDADAYRKTAAQTAAAIKATGGAAGVTAGSVADLSDKISTSDGVSKDAAQSVANMVLRFKGIKDVGANKVFDDTTQAVEDLAKATKRDATSTALQLGKALNDPTKNLGALSRAGVTFTAQQTKQIKAMQASGNLLGAQRIILDKVKSSYGGAAAAAVTPLQRLKIAGGELQQSVGEKLLPKLNQLATTGAAAFAWAQKNTGTVKAIAVAVGALASILLIYKVATAAVSAAQKVAAVATKVWAAGQWLLNAALDANPIGLIVIGIAALVIGLVIAYKKSATFRAIVVGAFNAVRNAAVAAFNWVKAHWPLILSILTGPIGAAVIFITRHWSTIMGIFKAAPGKIKSALGDVGSFLIGPFKDAFNTIADLWNNTVGRISFHAPSWVPGLGGKGFSVPKIPHAAAMGAMSAAPGLYLTGEGGPELIQTRGGERIWPNGQGPDGGAAISITNKGNTYYSYDPTSMAKANLAQARKALAVAGIR